MLIAARFLQGVGSAMAAAVVLGILVTLFPEPAGAGQGDRGVQLHRRRRSLDRSGPRRRAHRCARAGTGSSSSTCRSGWPRSRSRCRSLPGDRGLGLAAGADVIGAVLVTSGLMLGIYTVVRIEQQGGLAAPPSGSARCRSLLLAGFVVRQATARHPLMPLRIFRSRNVAGANLVQILMLPAMFAFQIIVALYMQKVLGYGAARHRPGHAARGGGHRRGVPVRLRPAQHPLRRAPVLLAGLALLFGRGRAATRIPVDADYVTDLLPVMLLIAVPAWCCRH